MKNEYSDMRVVREKDGTYIIKRLKDKLINEYESSTLKYKCPPLKLLTGSKEFIDRPIPLKETQAIEQTLEQFGVKGKIDTIKVGPMTTTYEFEPAPGTKIASIMRLQDDLSLAIGGRCVRIVPMIKGKAAVGIEVPHQESETVWLKNILEANEQEFDIPLVLGVSSSGKPIVKDLTKMPHLLMAGTTGSGKSVTVNSIIMGILYSTLPENVRLVLIDPKMLEFSVYNGIPHLLGPVITEGKAALRALGWLMIEMEERYKLMADVGVRNIKGYNDKISRGEVELRTEKEREENPDEVVHTGKLPYIVTIIDEFSDLMMSYPKEVESSVMRLAQKSRAAGIHLILATQRPSVDVITGVIKANFPARISFKVATKQDSRVILDENGAETLLGKGDMLLKSPDGSELERIHGAYMTESDIDNVVQYIKGKE